MKRIAWIFAAAVLAFASLFALLVVLLPRDVLKTRVGEQIAAWTGRDVSLSGEPEIGFFPRLTVTLHDVRVAGPAGMEDAEVLSVESLRGTIRLLPLIIGRVEVGSFAMERPVVRLIRDRAGERNWAFDSGAAALQLAFAGDVPLGEFSLANGTLLYEDRQSGAAERLDDVNLDISWASVRRPIALTGSARWRGEAANVSGKAEAPFDFLNGDMTPVELRLESAPLTIGFAGEASDIDFTRLAGKLSMTTPSLQALADWFDSPLADAETLGPASLAGNAVFHRAVLSVQDAELSLNGNKGVGAIEIGGARRMKVAGTLAFPGLDLSPYFSSLRHALAADPDWRNVKLDTAWFDELETDIRLSAGSVKLAGLSLGETAASLLLRDRRLEIGVAEAALGGGALSGDLAIADGDAPGEASVAVQLRAEGVDLADALAGYRQGIAGAADLMTDIAGEGTNLGSLLADLSGSASLEIANATLPLGALAEIAATGSLSGDAAAATTLESVTAGVSIADGVAHLDQAAALAPGFSATAQGTILLDSLTLSLDGEATTAGDAAEPRAFSIDGTLRRPMVRALAATE